MTAESAAFVNSVMSRYLDYNDSAPGNHPSDCIGGLLSIAEAAGADGKRLIAATIVAYEIIFRLAFGSKMRQKGWDQGFGLAVGTAAGAGHLLGLPADTIGHAVAIAATANVPLRTSRAGQLSYWKAAATPFAVKNGIVATLLAAEGMTGPDQPFEGRFGLWEQITGPFEIEPFNTEGGAILFQKWSRLKYWPVEYNAQIAVWAARELRTKLPATEVEKIMISTYHQSWHEIASEDAKWDPRTRETADHSLPYIFARTLVDGVITISSFDESAYLDPTLRPLMAKISARVDDEINAQFPEAVPIRVEAVSKTGEHFTVELVNPKGHGKNPMDTKDTEEKFRSLAEPLLGERQTSRALDAWWHVESKGTLSAALDLLIPAPVG
jgi:2-methylcitrate dehydratase